MRSRIHRILVFALLLAAGATEARATTERVVVLKADGLPFDMLDSVVRVKDPQTGKSVLPWIHHVFYERGARVQNFYSRGLSLSAPSWTILDTGQPGVIKGNLEFDRLTLQSYDYLNLLSRVLQSARGKETSTPAVAVIDEQRLPLISDAYALSERHVGAQALSRILPNALSNMRRLFTLQGPKEWLDEWTIGFEQHSIVFELLERDLLASLKKPEQRYLDFMIPVFDHTLHVSREPEAALHALQQIDRVVGAVWRTIEQSPRANRTALILVSDHGMNTSDSVYSQGYSLVNLFTSAAGGGHHIVTNRPPLGDYTLKSLSPVLTMITTTSPAATYLKGQSERYPTLLLDADGNERASVYLRDSELNILQILWQQLARKDLKPEIEKAARRAFFNVIDRNRPKWTALADQLAEELQAIELRIAQWDRRASKKSAAAEATLKSMEGDRKAYRLYETRLRKLLELQPDTFNPSRLKPEAAIAPRSMGATNSVHGLQNYVVGLSTAGLVIDNDGSLDMARSFAFVNNLELLTNIRARNNVQAGVASSPVDFVAVAIPAETISEALPQDLLPIETAVLLYQTEARQLLTLGRRDAAGTLELRCVPVTGLKQLPGGRIELSITPWTDDLPLEIWETLPLPPDARLAWLNSWRGEREWMELTHATRYSNAVVSLYEQFTFTPAPAPDMADSAASGEALLTRFHNRKRLLTQPDFIVFANDHWNFNYRDFNPGGNHGAFFRKSTQATLMFAGGSDTGIPEGLSIAGPYDTLSFAPTIFTLTGEVVAGEPSTQLREKGFRPFPGPVIRELFETPPAKNREK